MVKDSPNLLTSNMEVFTSRLPMTPFKKTPAFKLEKPQMIEKYSSKSPDFLKLVKTSIIGNISKNSL